MISTGFAYGERSKIADAYTMMYAPRSLMDESCKCGKNGCVDCDCKDADAKKTKTIGKLPVKHKIPAKTGSKLGVRKVLPFEKRDVKSSAKKFTPKVKKVSESARYFCIADGDRVLCTNDIGESYFNKGGTCGDMRIYESKISAMKDISKVKARRTPNSKYKVRACECIGESVQFADAANVHPVNEGLWDGIKSIGGGVLDAAKGVGNAVGGVAKGAGNLLQGNFAQAGQDLVGGLKDAGGNLLDAGKGIVGGAADATLGTASDLANAAGGVAKSAGNALQGDFKQAGEELKGAASSTLGAVSDDAREADIGGSIAKGAGAVGNALTKGAGAVGNALTQGAKAVGNTLAAGGKVAGGGLKSVGNLAQGNFAQAGQDLVQGVSAAKQDMVDAGKNLANAATNSNGQPQQQAQQQTQQKPGEQQKAAQQTSQKPGGQSQQNALSGLTPQLNTGNTPTNMDNLVSQMMATMPDSVKNYINQTASKTSPNVVPQQNGGQGGQQGGQDVQKQIQQIDSQIAELTKKKQSLMQQNPQK